MVSIKPMKWCQVFQKNDKFWKIHQYIEKRYDQCPLILRWYTSVFFKNCWFFEILKLFKITEVCARQAHELEQYFSKKSGLFEKKWPGWSIFFRKQFFFFSITGNFTFFRYVWWCNCSNLKAFARKCPLEKITLL